MVRVKNIKWLHEHLIPRVDHMRECIDFLGDFALFSHLVLRFDTLIDHLLGLVYQWDVALFLELRLVF